MLVVEDNLDNQKVLAHMLECYGCQVDIAGNGREAVYAAGQIAYACLFMDCQMPDMDGYTATVMLRQRQVQTGQRVPIIALTAGALPSDRERCLAAGMDDYLAKLAKAQELMVMLRKWTSFPAHAVVHLSCHTESTMSDPTCQACDTVQVSAHEPWGPMDGLDPIQEYRVLTHELQECFPDAEPQQLDGMIVREMALYGGYSTDVIAQAMCAASLHLAGDKVGDPEAYVKRTVDEAMQQASTDDTVLGWGG